MYIYSLKFLQLFLFMCVCVCITQANLSIRVLVFQINIVMPEPTTFRNKTEAIETKSQQSGDFIQEAAMYLFWSRAWEIIIEPDLSTVKVKESALVRLC